MAVACGHNYMAALTERGGLLVSGHNQHGQLGIGAVGEEEEQAPVAAPFGAEQLAMVAAGQFHAAGVTDRGGVWVWGLNHDGRLGLGHRATQPRPTRWAAGACAGSRVVMVGCGRAYTLALTEAGAVWSCGAAFGGGDVPAPVPGLGRVCMLAVSDSHGLALGADGRVWIWGDYWNGPDGHHTPAPETPAPPRALAPGAFAGAAVVFVAAGAMHSAAVTARGELWTWGCGLYGVLGLGDHAGRQAPALVGAHQAPAWAGSRVRTVACGESHTLVLTADGAVWHCGRRYVDADEEPPDAWVVRPARIAPARFGGARIVHVAAGEGFSAAVTDEGVLYVWGVGALCGGVLRVPRPVAASLPLGSRIGRGFGLPRQHVTAFCMGAHARLGGGPPPCAFRDAPANALESVVQVAEQLTGVYRCMGEGQLRLLAVRERVC